MEFGPLLICRVSVAWLRAIVRCDSCIHPAVGGITKVANGMFTHLVYFSPVAVSSRTHDFNFQVPRIGFSSASAIVEDRSTVSAVKAARLSMAISLKAGEGDHHLTATARELFLAHRQSNRPAGEWLRLIPFQVSASVSE